MVVCLLKDVDFLTGEARVGAQEALHRHSPAVEEASVEWWGGVVGWCGGGGLWWGLVCVEKNGDAARRVAVREW